MFGDSSICEIRQESTALTCGCRFGFAFGLDSDLGSGCDSGFGSGCDSGGASPSKSRVVLANDTD